MQAGKLSWGWGKTRIIHLYIVLAKNLVLFGAAFHEGTVRSHHKFILKPFAWSFALVKKYFASRACILLISFVLPLLPYFLKGGTKPIRVFHAACHALLIIPTIYVPVVTHFRKISEYRNSHWLVLRRLWNWMKMWRWIHICFRYSYWK